MKYRLLIVFLSSLLLASFCFNLIHYDAIIRAEQQGEFDRTYYPKILSQLHERLSEIEG